MSAASLDHLLQFLQRLEKAKIDYRLANNRDEAISVLIAVPGERWEVDFLQDGSVDVERFRSNGHIYGESILGKLFNEYSADSPEPSSDQIRKNPEEFYQYIDLPDKSTGLCGNSISAANSRSPAK